METLLKIRDVLLSNRFKSFYWRTGVMALVGLLALLTDAIHSITTNEILVLILVNIFSEITKFLNKKYLS